MRTNSRPSALAIELAERGLADAGRADEAEDRPSTIRIQLAHRQVLEDAVLHLLQAVVVGVEHLAGVGDVDDVLGRLVHGTATSQSM